MSGRLQEQKKLVAGWRTLGLLEEKEFLEGATRGGMLSHSHEKYGEGEKEEKKKKGEKRWHRGRGELRVDCITDILVSDVTVRKAIRFRNYEGGRPHVITVSETMMDRSYRVTERPRRPET